MPRVGEYAITREAPVMSAGDSRERLRDTIERVRARMAQIRDRKGTIGEQNTKAVLIEPIIEALGWDLRDLEEVVREYRAKTQDNPVDYALLLRRSPLLFIEAKDLGSDLADRRWVSQIMGYATVVGVEWCVLTDGNEYRIYNAHAPVDVDEKLFRAVCLDDEEAEDRTIETLLLLSKDKLGANILSELWQAYFVDCQVQRALEEMLIGDNPSLVRLIKRSVPELKPAQIRQSLARADVRVEFPTTSEALAAARTPQPPATDEPKEIRERAVIIGGEQHECRFAKDILVHVANWLVSQGRISAADCPVVVTQFSVKGKQRCLVNTAPQHPDGDDFRSPEELPNGLFIETAHSHRALERYSRRLLKWAGVDPAVMQVRWSG